MNGITGGLHVLDDATGHLVGRYTIAENAMVGWPERDLPHEAAGAEFAKCQPRA
jgi:hypothetical protein